MVDAASHVPHQIGSGLADGGNRGIGGVEQGDAQESHRFERAAQLHAVPRSRGALTAKALGRESLLFERDRREISRGQAKPREILDLLESAGAGQR